MFLQPSRHYYQFTGSLGQVGKQGVRKSKKPIADTMSIDNLLMAPNYPSVGQVQLFVALRAGLFASRQGAKQRFAPVEESSVAALGSWLKPMRQPDGAGQDLFPSRMGMKRTCRQSSIFVKNQLLPLPRLILG